MKKSASSRPVARPAPANVPPALAGVALALLAALLAAWVHRGALGNFFTTDDLILFERLQGHAEFPATLWRFVSGRMWWQIWFPVLGVQSAGWHVLVLVLHAAASALVFVWARRAGAGAVTALFAAIVFGTTARARTVVGQVAGAGEILAAIGALGALILLARDTKRDAALAWPAHVFALLCKESVALAPMVALVPQGTRASRGRVVAAMLAASVALWGYVLLARPATGSLGGEAYAASVGPHVIGNLLTYALWCADLLHLTSAVPTPLPLPWLAFAAAVLAALAVFAWRSGSVAARAGLLLWLLVLLPVLPLNNAVYEHYAYLARAGFALAMGEALVALVSRGAASRERRAAFVLGPLAVLSAGTAMLWLSIVSTDRLPQTGLLRDSFLRKMQVARNAAGDLAAVRESGASVVIYTPESALVDISSARGAEVAADTTARLRHQLLEAVTDGGRGLRALLPHLARVSFASRPQVADAAAIVAANSADGHLLVLGAGPAAHAELARLWARSGAAADAARHVREARALWPMAAELADSTAQPAPQP